MPNPSEAPRRRRRTTRPSARAFEVLSGTAIRIGGIGTIASVALILVFLVSVVAPLFSDARATERSTRAQVDAGAPRLSGLDPETRLLWTLSEHGRFDVRRVDDGALVETREFAGSSTLTAAALDPEGARVALGFADGRVQVGHIGFTTRFAAEDERDTLARAVDAHGRGVAGRELVERLPDGVVRLTALDLALEPATTVFEGEGVVALDRSTTARMDSVLALGARGAFALIELERRENMLTGEVELESRRHALSLERAPGDVLPARVLLNESATSAIALWTDGRLMRWDLRAPDAARIAQTTDAAPGEATVTTAAWMLGKTTLVVGTSRGALHAWFPVQRDNASTGDGIEFVRAHELARSGPAWVALASSARSRVLAGADADGAIRLWNVTNERELLRVEAGAAPAGLALAPKENALLALDASGARAWDLDLAHPEASVAALFRPVWYEGSAGPEHVWQSSSGTDSFEPKLGLWPLVFGTLKATVYSMLFAVPIALLAALYTSQFLSARLRAPIKAAVEMMASLPSVVLGFLAGVVVAPVIERVVPSVLLSFATVPLALLASAYSVQLLPEDFARRVDARARLALAFVALAAGLVLAWALGPTAERALFAGDLRGWLDGRFGSAFGGWWMLFLPAAAAVVALTWSRALEPRLRAATASWSRVANARGEALVFALGALAALAFAALVALGLTGLGADPRGGVLDTYVQRNSLVVGAMMGFAVIPIVFTIADDALCAVPPHLKLASIGAGATPWQTAVRVVLPTAASGLFSAIMVGLGRAVGETMIVLMATGNTPVTSWNVFDGFRTLSANIAVELPEAVKDSTHYRTLFLAALCLFAITFLFNTLAEVVRQRYRKRAARL